MTIPNHPLSIKEAVPASGFGRTLLYRLMREGRLPFLKVGKRRLILPSDLQNFLESMRVEVAQ